MKMFLSRAALFASALAALFSTSALAQQSKLDEVVARGKVIAGVSSESPPFGFVDDKGELVGFDIDIARLIAKVMFGDANKVELFRQPFSARWGQRPKRHDRFRYSGHHDLSGSAASGRFHPTLYRFRNRSYRAERLSVEVDQRS